MKDLNKNMTTARRRLLKNALFNHIKMYTDSTSKWYGPDQVFRRTPSAYNYTLKLVDLYISLYGEDKDLQWYLSDYDINI
jgi:hypothetical protein